MAAELFIQDLHPAAATPAAARLLNLTEPAKLQQPNCLFLFWGRNPIDSSEDITLNGAQRSISAEK
jgi:hypothetical protein